MAKDLWTWITKEIGYAPDESIKKKLEASEEGLKIVTELQNAVRTFCKRKLYEAQKAGIIEGDPESKFRFMMYCTTVAAEALKTGKKIPT